MAFYDGLGKRLQKTGQDALDKTKKTAEILKINNEISSLEKEMQEAYAAIGKLYFESHLEGEAGMVSYYEKIAECTAKIEENQDKVATLKGGVRCKKCGKTIAADATFCQYCGASTAEEPVQPEEPVQEAEEEQPETVEVQEEQQEEVIQAEEPAEPEPEVNAPSLKCPICGEAVEEGQAFCGNCGYQL